MVEIKHLFDGYNPEGYHSNGVHVGEMVNLIGHPPEEFLRRSPHSWRLFDDNGKTPNVGKSIRVGVFPMMTRGKQAVGKETGPPRCLWKTESSLLRASARTRQTSSTSYVACYVGYLKIERPHGLS